MSSDPQAFFATVIGAGAILAGFCGTFLAFRIQREANYYRQPVLDYDSESAKDIPIGLTHFTTAFLLVSLATLCSMFFGFLLPLLAIAGSTWALAQKKFVVAGLTATLILLVAYFVDELVHYKILTSHLMNDAFEHKRENRIVYVAVCAIGLAVLLIYILS